ncbi:LytR/AlgR family response regulator transcription factor [Algoriphagus algorifonticola]|uniref:LytR/AlgR family response regulator transcription factor n=1 Tax=Algoriphagus algorifonticola TaxID=2593007 RepID=UPI0011A415C0|nr:response regulator transcription factor [Algoriphagus algorifonticola]
MSSNFKPKLVLIEDNLNLSENLCELLEINNYNVIATYDSAENVLESLKRQPPDLALIDIKLKGEENGIQLATKIRSEIDIPLVFITSSSGKEVISRVSHLKPDGFIVKPFTTETLITSIELAFTNHSGEKNNETIDHLVGSRKSKEEFFVRENGWLKKIKTNDVDWIKTEGTYTHIYVKGRQFTLRNTIKEVMGVLDENQFLRVHKSYIINLEQIDAFNSTAVKIDDHEIPIGRNFYKDLVALVNKINN